MNNKKSLSLCIIGKPNAGKSTLLNRIIGQKLSIVTPKVQTTRSIITGIVTFKDTQLVIFDTPGIFEPKRKLEKAMVRSAWSSLNGADLVTLIIDGLKPIDDIVLTIIKRLASLKITVVFLLNKADVKDNLIEKHKSKLIELVPACEIFEISARDGHGVDKFLDFLHDQATVSPWLYEEDDLTTLPMRFLAAEITREQLFLQLNDELPYQLTVDTELWQEQADSSVKINQVIIVSRESYKTIILGKHGAKIKEIGIKSRQEIEKNLEIKVHLFLFVKVRKSWEDDPHLYDSMNLKF